MSHSNNHVRPEMLQKLLDDIHDPISGYKHLQIILNRKNDNIRSGLGQEYFVVSPNCFDVYGLNDLDYNDGVILMTLTNITTGNSAQINLDVSDEHPQVFLLNWNDVRNMAFAGHSCNNINGDLLELENNR